MDVRPLGALSPSDEKPLDENGRLWTFEPLESRWLFLDPPPHTDYPCARYQHASTASQDGNSIFIHAGCAADGSRLTDA